MYRSPLIAASCAAAWAMAATSAGAQAMHDRFWFEASAFKPDIDTSVRVSSANGAIGTDINLESDLNLADRETLPAFFGGARLGKRWAITGEYFELSRDGSASLERPIVFDDVTYPAGVTVSSGFDTTVYRLSVAYSFVRNDRLEIGAALGAHVTQFEVELAGEGFVGNAAIQGVRRQRDALAPLPTLGLYGGYRVTPRLTLGGRVDYLSLKVGDYDGDLTNVQATATYRLFRNVGAGVMYRYVDYGLKVDKDRWNGDLAYQFSGPAVFLQVVF